MHKTLKGLLYAGAALIVLAMPVFAQGQPRTVPEPGTITMIVSGLGAIAGLRYYKLRK